jgi:hypothetical protein
MFTRVKVCFLCFIWTTSFCVSKKLFNFKEIRDNQSIYLFPLFFVWHFCYEVHSKPYNAVFSAPATQRYLHSIYCAVGLAVQHVTFVYLIYKSL